MVESLAPKGNSSAYITVEIGSSPRSSVFGFSMEGSDDDCWLAGVFGMVDCEQDITDSLVTTGVAVDASCSHFERASFTGILARSPSMSSFSLIAWPLKPV